MLTIKRWQYNSVSLYLFRYITQEGHKLETGGPRPPATVTNAVSWRSEGIKYRKNEVFLDVIESVNLLVRANLLIWSRFLRRGHHSTNTGSWHWLWVCKGDVCVSPVCDINTCVLRYTLNIPQKWYITNSLLFTVEWWQEEPRQNSETQRTSLWSCVHLSSAWRGSVHKRPVWCFPRSKSGNKINPVQLPDTPPPSG